VFLPLHQLVNEASEISPSYLHSLDFSVEKNNFHILALLVRRLCFVLRLRHTSFPYKTKDLKFMNTHSVIFISIIEIPEMGWFLNHYV